MLRCLFLVVILGGVLLPGVQAQTPTPDPALIDAGLAALALLQNATSYVEAQSTIEDTVSTIRLDLAGQVQEQNTTTRRMLTENTRYINTAGTKNIQSQITVDFAQSVIMAGQQQNTAYLLQGEVRWVDGQLYVLAEYLNRTPDLEAITLPTTWLPIPDPANFPVFAPLELAQRFQAALGQDYNLLRDDREAFRAAISTATREDQTLPDGTPVTAITLTVNYENMVDLLARDPSFTPGDMSTLLLNVLDAESMYEITISIDAEGLPRRVQTRILLQATDVDFYALDPINLPPGLTVTFRNEERRDSLYTELNAPLEPVSVPE